MHQAMLSGLAVAAVLGAFTAGVVVGKETKATVVEVKMPDTVTLEGIPSSKADCAQWVTDHMDKPTAGVIGVICNGRE